jgi:hypothetical protein
MIAKTKIKLRNILSWYLRRKASDKCHQNLIRLALTEIKDINLRQSEVLK